MPFWLIIALIVFVINLYCEMGKTATLLLGTIFLLLLAGWCSSYVVADVIIYLLIPLFVIIWVLCTK